MDLKSDQGSTKMKIMYKILNMFWPIGLLIVFTLSISHKLKADTIRMKNGQVYSNTMTVVLKDSVAIVFKNGKLLVIPKSKIDSLSRYSPNWSKVDIERTTIRLENQIKKLSEDLANLRSKL